ncbi:mRNA surveillance protein pelota [archaeon]|jgi:protein pelota|nr:mRNA surveillance protein pelota [archaeon]MBT4396971.1 mRNA surveillance protein pelota [archaeon]MBT4440962.1 mRNA surveillance protein pelota [archaeon]
MKIIFQDIKKGEVKLLTNSLDDLWFLSNIIDENDLITGKTIRKIRLGEDERNTKIIKKVVTLEIKAEKIEFHKYSNSLRVSGKITQAPEDIPRGFYHTFDIDDKTTIKIRKLVWPKYQLQRLKESTEEKISNILICALDREQATFALLTPSGYKILTEIEGQVQKKEVENKNTKDFYLDIAKIMKEYVDRYNLESIILASPAFWKEDLMKEIKKKYSQLTNKITLATCNTLGKNAIEEVLKRKEVESVLKKDRTTRETQYVEELLEKIAANKEGAYGIKEVKQASDAGAIKKLLVTDEIIHKLREENKFEELDKIMKAVDQQKGDVHIISTDHEAGKKLQGLGGIGAILRYNLNY